MSSLFRIGLAIALTLGSGPCNQEATFTVSDLPRVVLQQADAPEGFSLESERSGRVPTRPEEQAAAYRTFLILSELAGRNQIPEGSPGYVSFAMVHADSQRASDYFNYATGRGLPPGAAGVRAKAVENLGEESAIIAKRHSAGVAEFLYISWRRSNLVMVLMGQDVGIEEARSLAWKMDVHADSVAGDES